MRSFYSVSWRWRWWYGDGGGQWPLVTACRWWPWWGRGGRTSVIEGGRERGEKAEKGKERLKRGTGRGVRGGDGQRWCWCWWERGEKTEREKVKMGEIWRGTEMKTMMMILWPSSKSWCASRWQFLLRLKSTIIPRIYCTAATLFYFYAAIDLIVLHRDWIEVIAYFPQKNITTKKIKIEVKVEKVPSRFILWYQTLCNPLALIPKHQILKRQFIKCSAKDCWLCILNISGGWLDLEMQNWNVNSIPRWIVEPNKLPNPPCGSIPLNGEMHKSSFAIQGICRLTPSCNFYLLATRIDLARKKWIENRVQKSQKIENTTKNCLLWYIYRSSFFVFFWRLF